MAAGLSACASISEKFRNTASQMPAIGLPAGAPERTAEPVPFPAVHDLPPPRNSVTLTEPERDQMQRDLAAARDTQRLTEAEVEAQAQAKTKAIAAAAKAAAARPIPASARAATIY
jgi:hypothetical protein